MHSLEMCACCVVFAVQELVVETIDKHGNTRPRFLMYDIMQFEVSVTKNRTCTSNLPSSYILCKCAHTYCTCARVCVCV